MTSNAFAKVRASLITAEVIDEIFSPLLMGGTGIVATEPVTAAGISFLASIAMALPTMRGILGDEKAFAYFEGSLKESREQHPFLGRSYPGSVGTQNNASTECLTLFNNSGKGGPSNRGPLKLL